MADFTCYCRSGTKISRITREEVPARLAAGEFLWVDIEGAGKDEAAWLGNTFGFHPLTLSDILNEKTRAKQEPYDDGVLFIVIKALNFNRGHDRLETINLNFFVTTKFLVTTHRLPSRGVVETKESLDCSGDAFSRGPGYLAYKLIDHAVDYYLDLLNDVDAAVSQTEKSLFAEVNQPLKFRSSPEKTVKRIFSLKKRVTQLRRSIRPKRDLLNELIHSDYPQFDETCRTHLRDVLDHVSYIGDTLEAMPDNLTMLLEVHLTQIANRQNEVMKVLSVVSTVMLPLTLVASIFGMNFEFIPYAHSPIGFFAMLATMVGIGFATLWVLRRRGFM